MFGPDDECPTPNGGGTIKRPPRRPITSEELKTVVHRGAGNKGPGSDGIGLAFFNVNWDTIKDDMLALFNLMCIDGIIRDQQKYGLVVCISKKPVPPN